MITIFKDHKKSRPQLVNFPPPETLADILEAVRTGGMDCQEAEEYIKKLFEKDRGKYGKT